MIPIEFIDYTLQHKKVKSTKDFVLQKNYLTIVNDNKFTDLFT